MQINNKITYSIFAYTTLIALLNKEKVFKFQNKIETKIKNFIENPNIPPFREWFIPVMIIVILSPLMFIWINAGYGVSYDLTTGELDLYDPHKDPQDIDPMDVYPKEMSFFLAIGYFLVCGLLAYWTYQYYLKRWELWLKYVYKK